MPKAVVQYEPEPTDEDEEWRVIGLFGEVSVVHGPGGRPIMITRLRDIEGHIETLTEALS